MLDRDLAELYEVKAIALRQQVKRNELRFPPDFMFQLTAKEADLLVLLKLNVIPSRRSLGGSLPYVFTQEGVAMLSSVLNSSRAVQVNKDLAQKIAAMEKKYDAHFSVVFKAIKRLLEPPAEPKRRIGFYTGDK